MFDAGKRVDVTLATIREAYGYAALTKRTVYRWFKKFREGDRSPQDEARSGRPSDYDDDRLKSLVKETPAVTIRELVAFMCTSFGTIQRHFHLIGMVRIFCCNSCLNVK
uniref:Mos1 transposase HTH domain-containing protein n=1 Tax=Ditylenchus dipsaci TaxID=166011 RepID=A0A915EQT2_9BILA